MKFFSFILLFFSSKTFGAYYDVLPKGVRNLTYQYTMTGEITGRYTNSGNLQGYNINANINADSIKGINAAVDTYLGTLSAEDYKNFSFGTFQGAATSEVKVQGLGGGYGLTDKVTIYGFIPFYSATVNLNIERTEKGRNNVGTAIQLENLPDVDVRLIQSLFVNYYKYQPLGRWQATDFGDLEMGAMYQLRKWRNAGALINTGFVAPTGRQDNPDILQDIAFGDGQWDAFFEFGVGYTFSGKLSDFSFDQWNRATYQFPYNTDVRLPSSSAFPVTSTKGNAHVKLGNKAQTNLQGNYRISDDWGTSLTYSLEYKEKDDYRSSNAVADSILEEGTERISHTGRFSLGYTTLNLFKQKRFFLPLSLNLAVQSIFAGKNTPKYERADFQIRMFF
nr:transporter [Bacteriovorax sp. HI3]